MGLKFLLVLVGVAFLMWGNTGEQSEPEPFTWSGLAIKVFLIIFFYMLITALFLLMSELVN